MFFVYVIRSKFKNFTYVGITDNIDRKVDQHNLGYNKSTKHYRPFKLIYFEEHNTRQLAREREKFLKSGKGREFLKQFK